MGNDTAALARYTRILGLAQDSSTSGRLDDPSAAARWSPRAFELGGIRPVRTRYPGAGLFGVLDAGERWLAVSGTGTGAPESCADAPWSIKGSGKETPRWRPPQEALAVALQHPHAPGDTLTTYRYRLGGHSP